MNFIRRRVATSAVALTLTGGLLAACSGGGSNSGSTASTGGTVTFAENQSAGAITSIFPLNSFANNLPSNAQFQALQWTPLYWFGQDASLAFDPSLSIAKAPVYSDGNRTVRIALKSAEWSDGKPITSRDVQFFINIAKVDENNWANYVAGEFPTDIASVTLDGPHALTLHLTKAFSPTWFTQSQLSEIIPLPQHAWDKTSANGTVGQYDLTSNGAKAVLNYLTNTSKDTATYVTNPVWQVVDGPWHLVSYNANGYAALVPNPKYDIGPKPTISRFVMQPFSSDAAEANDLSQGALTYGYVPISDLSAAARFEAGGYTLSPWPLLSIDYIVLNFNNPAVGSALKQLYVRQAMESLIDQHGYLESFLGQAGIPNYGPVPLEPANPYVSAASKTNLYPYSPSHAAALLRGHGWHVVPNGVTTCASPGNGPTQCGPGVKAGTRLAIALQYLSGLPYLDNEMQSLKSAMAAVGIDVSLSTGTEGQVVGNASPCTGGSACGWQAAQWGTPSWIWNIPYPTGVETFGTGGGANAGSFSSPTVDADIAALETTPTAAATAAAWAKYEEDVAKDLPVLWIPNTVNQVSAISTKLVGATPQNPLLVLAPSTWSLKK